MQNGQGIRKHTIAVLVENKFGVLSRVAGLFSARGYNIESLSVGETLDPTVSRMTLVVRGDQLVIEGTAGRVLAPAGTAPSEPSLEFAIRRDRFFDSKTGALLHATVTPAGREPPKVGDRVAEASGYEIAGDLEQHVWFDESGAWVQWRLWRQGAAITLVRE